MTKIVSLCVGLFVLLGIVAWDNWQVRDELRLLQEKSKVNSNINTAALRQAGRTDCPVDESSSSPSNQYDSPKNKPIAPTAQAEIPSVLQKPTISKFPPGTTFDEAIRLMQLEQASLQTKRTAVASPFGAAP